GWRPGRHAGSTRAPKTRTPPGRHPGRTRGARPEPAQPARDKQMFLFIGRRYPWVSLVGGAVALVIGIVTGLLSFEIVGALGLAVGGYRTMAALRRLGIGGIIGRTGGAGGAGGLPGTLR